MKKITTIFALLLLCAVTAMAQTTTVTIVDGGDVNNPYDTYGTRSDNNTKFTSNTASGLAGLTIVAPAIDRALWWKVRCLALKPSAAQTTETVTITAPSGYFIKDYTVTLQANSSDYPYEVWFAGYKSTIDGGSAKTFTQTNLFVQSTSFSIRQTKANWQGNSWLAAKFWTVTLVSEEDVVEVTYVVNDANNTPLFTSEPQKIVKGSTVTTLPKEFQRAPFYTYNELSETINESKSVTFTATLKQESEWPVKYTEDATNPYYYNMKIRGQYLVYDASVTDEVKLQETSEPFNPDAAWAFIGTPYDGFKVVNNSKGASNVLTYTTVTMDRPTTHNIQFQTGAEAEAKTWLIDTNDNGIVLRMKENQNIYFHHENGNVKYLRTCSNSEWSYVHGDEGSTIILSTDEDVLVQLYNMLKDAPIGEGPNKYSVTGVNPEEILANAATVIENEETSQYATTYNALLDLQNAMTLNMPTAGFYRIKGNTSGKYVSNGGGSGSNYTMVETADETTIFCYDGEKLINYKTGLCFNVPGWTWVYGNETIATTFVDGLSNGGYAIQNGENDKKQPIYLYDDNNGVCDRGAMDNITTSTNARYRNWYLEEVTTLSVKMNVVGDKSYATFFSPVAISQVNGAEVYVVNETKDNSVVIEKATAQAIPAGKGVMLVSDAKNTSATLTIGEAEDFPTATGLNGVTASEQITKDTDPYNSNLFLSKKDGKIGFYKIKTTKKNNEDVYVGVTGGFKAYLSTAAGAKEGFELEFGGVTGIENMEHGTLNMENGAIYNLQGQRVNKAQKGVFIQNGKKVVLK